MANKKNNNPEMIIAISALLVGVVTTFTSIYSAYIDREYARASVWPKLELYRSYDSNSFSYGVANKGTGPAIINYVTIRDGNEYIKQWRDLKSMSESHQGRYSQSHISSITISPQDRLAPITLDGERAQLLYKKDNSDNRLQITICYCSIYQECWVVDRSSQPSPVSACEVADDLRFLQ